MIESANKDSASYKQLYDDNHEFVDEYEVDKYKGMMGIHAKFGKKKFLVVGAFVVFILLTSFISPKARVSYELSDNLLYYVFLLIGAVVLNIALSFFLHYAAYYKLVNNYIESEKSLISQIYGQLRTLFSSAIKVISFLISPDYYFASKYKDLLIKKRIPCTRTTCYRDSEHQACPGEWDTIRNSRKFFVEFSNWYNVILTVWTAFFVTIILMWFSDRVMPVLELLNCVLLFRLVSRSFEICWAYYKDIVRVDVIRFSKELIPGTGAMDEPFFNGWKRSSIRRSGRISLAVHTLFEIMILYSLLYYFQYVFYLESFKGLGFMGFKQQELYSYYNFLLHSISVSCFNISFGPFPTKGWLFLHVSQVLTSMVLIIVSLATYLSSRDDVTVREENFFKRVLSRNQT